MRRKVVIVLFNLKFKAVVSVLIFQLFISRIRRSTNEFYIKTSFERDFMGVLAHLGCECFSVLLLTATPIKYLLYNWFLAQTKHILILNKTCPLSLSI